MLEKNWATPAFLCDDGVNCCEDLDYGRALLLPAHANDDECHAWLDTVDAGRTSDFIGDWPCVEARAALRCAALCCVVLRCAARCCAIDFRIVAKISPTHRRDAQLAPAWPPRSHSDRPCPRQDPSDAILLAPYHHPIARVRLWSHRSLPVLSSRHLPASIP